MFSKKLSISVAYTHAWRILTDHFAFFLMANGIGCLVMLLFLVLVGGVDFLDIRYHWSLILQMFHYSVQNATGPLYYLGYSLQEVVSKYLPSDMMQYLGQMEHLTFDVSSYNITFLLSMLIPSMLILKFVIDTMTVGWINIALKTLSNSQVSFKDLYQYFYLTPRVFILNLVIMMATIIGCFLLVFPGIFIYQRLRFSIFFVIDKNLSIIKALQASWAITKGSVVELSGYSSLMNIILSISSMLPLSGLVLVPFNIQVEADLYKQIIAQN